MPLLILIFLKSVAFYEYDTKQKYIKNLLDKAAYHVRIKGNFTEEDYSELKLELENLVEVDAGHLLLYSASSLEGSFKDNSIPYYPGTELHKGDYFSIEFFSSEVSNLSRLQNMGVAADDSKNLKYGGKTLTFVERYD